MLLQRLLHRLLHVLRLAEANIQKQQPASRVMDLQHNRKE
jgi:hypothetical protein